MARYAIAGVCVIAIAGILGWVAYKRLTLHPSDAALSQYVAASLAPLPVKVAAIDPTYGAVKTAGTTVTYRAQIETTEPLFRRLDTADYLRANAANDLSAIDAADALLAGPNGAQVRTAAALPAASMSPIRSITLLTTQTPPGTIVACTGTLVAWRHDGIWTLSGEPARLDKSILAGTSRPAGADVFAVDLPADAARLKTLIADRVATAAKIRAAAVAVTEQLNRERQQRTDAFAQLLQPGTLFTGAATDATKGDSWHVVVEITDSAATTQHVGALLRNDGGWSDARTYTGDWALDADGMTCVLTLRTRAAEKIDGAGPLLSDARDSSMTLRLRSDGNATVSPGNWQLARVAPADAAAIKTDLMHPMTQALGVTKVGMVYRGTVTTNQTKKTETVLLRFTEQGQDGALLRATVESTTTRNWVRPFRGTIVGNTYRAGGSPIRLRTEDKDAIVQADQWSLLGMRYTDNSLTLTLRIDGDRLVGNGALFTYEFQRVPETDSAGALPGGPEAQRVGVGAGASRGSDDRRVGGSASGAEASAATSTPGMFGLPAFPNYAGAYVLRDGGWQPLPRNNGHAMQSKIQVANAALLKLKQWEDSFAKAPTATPADVVADLVFDGHDVVPIASAKDVIIVYIGAITPPTPAQVAKYPVLKDEPAIELASAKTLANGVRDAALLMVAPGFMGFGPTRVVASVEQPSGSVYVLRASDSRALRVGVRGNGV